MGTTTEETNEFQLPVWAPRLRKSQIERLYKSCGQGYLDEELIDDVGYTLYARCESMLQVTSAVRGRPLCPGCEIPAERTGESDPMLHCPKCGWECPWKAFQKTYQRKNLNAGGMQPSVSEFVRKFPATQPSADRLVLIDALIHRFHWESGDRAGGRPGVSNLIEGRMKATMDFLDRLSYGDDVPSNIGQTREAWRRKWRSNPWAHGKGQGS